MCSNGLTCDMFVYEQGHCMAWLLVIYGHGVTIKPRVQCKSLLDW